MAILNVQSRMCLVVSMAFMPVLYTTTALAEWYVGADGGLSYPGAFTNVTLSDPKLSGGIRDARVNDLELHTSLAGGLKADVYSLKPDVKQQDVVGGRARGPVFVDTLQGIPLRLPTVAANIIIRPPSMSDVFQPYGGMGYALFLAIVPREANRIYT